MNTTRYRLHKLTNHGRFVVTENAKGPLHPYRAIEPLSTPWAGTRVGVGSILMLSDATAEKMLAVGGIEALVPVTLRPWREVEDERQRENWKARRAKLSQG